MSTERFEGSIIPPDIEEGLKRMEEVMRDKRFNHAGVPTQFAIDLWREKRIDSFAGFERMLRLQNSRVHFLAVPLNFFGTEYATTYPLENNTEEPQYTLYVAVNGELEAAQMRKKLNLSTGDNFQRLNTTGVITLPKERVPAND